MVYRVGNNIIDEDDHLGHGQKDINDHTKIDRNEIFPSEMTTLKLITQILILFEIDHIEINFTEIVRDEIVKNENDFDHTEIW